MNGALLRIALRSTSRWRTRETDGEPKFSFSLSVDPRSGRAVVVIVIGIEMLGNAGNQLRQRPRQRGERHAQIRPAAVGTSVADWDPPKIIECRADGTCISKFTVELTNTMTFAGVWQVKQGMIISTMTNTAPSGEPFGVETNKVVSIDPDKLVVRSGSGGTNKLVFHKRYCQQDRRANAFTCVDHDWRSADS